MSSMPKGIRSPLGTMLRMMGRCIMVLHAISWLPLANAGLTDISYSAPSNMMASVAQKLILPEFQIRKPCEVTPDDFDVRLQRNPFFVVQCVSTIEQVQVYINGEHIFNEEGQGIPQEGYLMTLEVPNQPTILELYSCDDDIFGDLARLSECLKFRVSVFRNGDHLAELSEIGVTSSRLVNLKPNFDPFHFEYNTTVRIGEPLVISASVKQEMARVGIEYDGDNSALSGLPPKMRCGHGTHANDAWKLPGFKAIGEYKYKLCALAADKEHVTEYHLKVVVTPQYSSKLTSIDVGSYTLEPDFSPDVLTYSVVIPGTTMSVPLNTVAKDGQSGVQITYEGQKDHPKDDDQIARGSSSTTVLMHDNTKLKEGQAPQWQVPVMIHVHSADGQHHLAYVVTFKQVVSRFSKLKNITIGSTDCVLTPAFDPEIWDYTCEWWWEDANHNEKIWGEVIPHMELVDCKDCELLVPNCNKKLDTSSLDLDWENEKRERWNDGQMWRRSFLYGDVHIVPFQVVSADKYHNTVYRVRMDRNCPWWMASWLTRFVSRTASALSVVMAISSAANIMALAKQVQFMTLTTEIDDTPPVYIEFASGLKNFNLDAFGWINWEALGIPSVEKVEKMKQNLVKYLEHQLGIDHATLLLQYCEAIDTKGMTGDMLYPNAILHLDPEKSATLLYQLQEKKRRDDLKEAQDAAIAAQKAAADKAAGKNVATDAGKPNFFSPGTGTQDALKRRLSDHVISAISQWFYRWSDSASRIYFDPTIHDVKVALRGSGISLNSSSSMVIDHMQTSNYPMNSSLASFDTFVWQDNFMDMQNVPVELGDRRLGFGDDALEEGLGEEEEEEEKDFGKLIDWTDDDYATVLELVKNQSGVTEDQLRGMYPEIRALAPHSCDGKEVQVVEKTVKIWHQLLLFRDMLESTTGVFLILSVSFVISGSIYYAFYMAFMKGNQRRPRVLEPGPLVIFVCDYCLIAFAKSAAKVLFRPQQVTFFSWTPSDTFVRTVCGMGLFFYPTCFVFLIWYRVINLMHRRRLTWNKELDSYSDPRCQSLKVTLPPKRIPAFVPIIYQVCINHIRACVPVLDEEGEKLDFEGNRNSSAIKIEDSKQRGDADQFEAAIDEEIEKELAEIHDNEENRKSSFLQNKQKMLQEEHRKITQDKQRKNDHEGLLSNIKKIALEKAQKTRDLEEYYPPWFDLVAGDDHDTFYKAHGLAEVVDTFKSKKRRSDLERIDQEEKLAMMQWINEQIRHEGNLLKYNILKCAPEGGYLKPFEPVRNKETNAVEWNWLPKADDYNYDNNPSHPKYNKRGHHEDLDEFMGGDGVRWIEDELGQRLIYPGNDNWFFFGCCIPGGNQGGTLKWMHEPDEGWPAWEAEQATKANPMMYADKWQWLYMNEAQPWNEDDEGEDDCCCGLKKNELPLYPEVKARILKIFASRVPYKVSEFEKVEMRKWMWKELLKLMEIKMKIGYMADQHPKFYSKRTYTEIADTDFHKLWFQIENATPAQDKLLDHEKKNKMIEQTSKFELLDYTLMRVEDTYSYQIVEPWMKEVDPVGENEYKVMFDTDSFWRTHTDPELKDIRLENELVPKHGYFSSTEFMNFPDREFGVKRYNLLKPDGSISKVKVNVLMRHVLPLMRYTSGFKVNVPMDSLDMPFRDEYNIVIGSAKYGEEYNYVVERFTTLVSIILLAGDPRGQVMALLFMCTKGSSWLYNFRVAYQSKKYDQQVDEQNYLDQLDQQKGDQEEDGNKVHQELDLTAQDLKLKKFKKKSRVTLAWQAFLAAEVMRLFMQTLTLVFLVWGQFGMPAPLCAMCCIIMCCVTMVSMNFRTFTQELKAIFAQLKDFWSGALAQYRTFRNSAQAWLEGDNIFGYQFFVFEEKKSMLLKADNIHLIVPDLGITFEGEAEISDDLPPEEARAMEVGKRMVHYSMERKDDDDKRYKSVRDHPRYEGDLSSGLFVALDVEQVMLRKQLPEIMATIHCVNHTDSSLSRPQYDSYLTLTKELPGGEQWEPEYDQDRDKMQTLLDIWAEKFEQWLDKKLGAVESEKTATVKIKDHLKNLLANECTGRLLRDMYYLKIDKVRVPVKGGLCQVDIVGKCGYVQIVYENEVIPQTSFTDRRSKFGRFVLDPEVNGKGPQAILDLSSEVEKDGFSFRVPVGVSRVKLAIWVQESSDDLHGTEHLVAFSQETDISKLVPDMEEDAFPEEPLDVPVYIRWKLRGPRLVALGVPEDHVEYVPDTWADWLKDKLWKLFTCFYCRHVPTEEELEKIRGHMNVYGRQFSEKELEEDTEMMVAIEDVTQGESSMNHAKVERHMDRWLTMAKGFGVAVGVPDLEHMEKHNKDMEIVGKDLKLIDDKFSGTIKSIQSELSTFLSSVDKKSRKLLGWDAQDGNNKEEDDNKHGQDAFQIGKRQSETNGKEEGTKGSPREDPKLYQLERRRAELQDRLAAEEDKARKEKRDILMEKGFRRQLEKRDEMKAAIARVRKQIERYRAAIREDEEKGIAPLHLSHIVRRIVGRNVSQVLLTTEQAKKVHEGVDEKWFANALLDHLIEYRANKMTSSKQILHYIIMSDQLKPSKAWRPDAISPHVCSIVTREFDDVPEVMLIDYFKPGSRVPFARQGNPGDPELVNNKLCYKANEKAWFDPEGNIRFDVEGKEDDAPMHEIFLYWDGHRRWVISARRGEKVPYGLRQEDVQGFMWAQDVAVTPDKIAARWNRWRGKKWQPDESMKVLGPNTQRSADEKKGRKNILASLSVQDDSVNTDNGERHWLDCRALCSEVCQLFSRTDSRRHDPELKDCLVSLSADSLQFAWKDDHIERLASFRGFLLSEFGTYDQAWMYMSRWVSFPKQKGIENLANLFKESFDAFEKAYNQGEIDRAFHGRGDDGDDHEGSPALKRSATKESTASGLKRSATKESRRAQEEEKPAARPAGMLMKSKSKMNLEDDEPSRSNTDLASMPREKTDESSATSGLSKVSKERKMHRSRTGELSAHGRSRTGDLSAHGHSHSHHKRKNKRTLTRSKTYASKMRDLARSETGAGTEKLSSYALTEEEEDNNVDLRELNELKAYLETNRDPMSEGTGTWKKLAMQVFQALDKDGSGAVSVNELHDIYETGEDAPTDGVLLDFRDWCMKHPWYKEFSKLWAELSDGVEVSMEDFRHAMRHVLLKFLARKRNQVKDVVGASLHDEDNVCTIKSAQWENHLEEDKKTTVRVMVMKFVVIGKSRALPMCKDKGAWSIRAEGVASEFKPMELPESLVPNSRGELSVTLKYKGLPESRKVYFQFGKGGLAVARVQFTEVSFYPNNPGAPDEKAEQIFADLDVAMSGGISLKELIPVSGDRMEDVARSLLKFTIPLAYVQEILPQPHKTYGIEKKQAIQIKVNAQFATSVEWIGLKTALDPEWKCESAQTEYVHFAMRPAYYDLWKQVILECEMLKPQEWVRFYDGGYMEHQNIKGIYCRNGYGIQRWSDGTVYAGFWEMHSYHGEGRLYAKVEDWQKVLKGVAPGEMAPTPIYHGNWYDGSRNGRGTLSWEQESTSSSEQKNPFNVTKHIGIRKVYYGNFKNGLFHGSGLLVMRDAVSQRLPQMFNQTSVGGRQMRRVMWPNISPNHMLRFEGEFFSDWDEVDEEVRRMDPSFDKLYEGENSPHLRLGDLRKEDQRRKSMRYQRFFGVDRAEVQKAGAPMPDVGLAFYRMKLDGAAMEGMDLREHQEPGIPAETTHIEVGKATYSDGSEYEGEFSHGWPEGLGKLTQFDPEEVSGGESSWIARYDGEWHAGEREGQGVYEIKDQLQYQGEWKDNRKNGQGMQTIDDDWWPEFGYKTYDGEWQDDLRHGKGQMTIPSEDSRGHFLFDGEFMNNNRHGFGVMKYVTDGSEEEGMQEEDIILYNGMWANDKVYSPVGDPSWSYMVSPDKDIRRYYFGGLNEKGERSGHGILYDSVAYDDEAFKKCFNATNGGDKAFRHKEEHKYVLYDGQWRDNLPHGHGIQYFVEMKGKYEGQFVNGKRQGRGTWTGDAGQGWGSTWTYRPVPGEGTELPPNWDDDKMHGIGIVEDAKHVHENVIYTQGVCQMPFTMEGPPTTGFDDTRIIGTAVKAVRQTVNINKTHKTGDTRYAGATLLSQGVGKALHGQRVDDTLDAAMGAGVLVRQPTDLNNPEEDVLVFGGSGSNEIMNGLYFKMTGTFGLPIYKLIKKERGLFGSATERFLYQNSEKSMWIIGPRYGEPLKPKEPNVAVIESPALHPSQISGKWYVWHDDSGRIRMPNDPTDPLEETKGWRRRPVLPIDELSIQSIVGFAITGATPDFAMGFSSNLLLRNPREFYSRPVYEAENGGQYLYWIPGSYDENSNDARDTLEEFEQRIATGLVGEQIDSPAEVGEVVNIFRNYGAWIIAPEVGALPGSAKCVAWIVDNGATPDQIDDEFHKWVVRDFTEKSEKPVFKVNAAMRLVREEWSRNPKSSLGMLDGEEELQPLLDKSPPRGISLDKSPPRGISIQ